MDMSSGQTQCLLLIRGAHGIRNLMGCREDECERED